MEDEASPVRDGVWSDGRTCLRSRMRDREGIERASQCSRAIRDPRSKDDMFWNFFLDKLLGIYRFLFFLVRQEQDYCCNLGDSSSSPRGKMLISLRLVLFLW